MCRYNVYSRPILDSYLHLFFALANLPFLRLLFALKRYRQRASVNAGKEIGWIDGWLPKFVDSVGLEVAKQLLPNYTTKK